MNQNIYQSNPGGLSGSYEGPAEFSYDNNKNKRRDLSGSGCSSSGRKPSRHKCDPKDAFDKCKFMKFHYRTHLGWFKKLFGFGLLLISLTKSALNERAAVSSTRAYEEGLRSVQLLSSTHEVLEENEGKLVHVYGKMDVLEPLEESTYGVSIPAVKLKRRVQMYQWIEERSTHSEYLDEAPVTYNKGWRDRPIQCSGGSAKESHENPEFGIESEVRVNPAIRLGSFTLSPELKDKFTDFIQFTSGERPGSSAIKMHMGLYYHAPDLWNPAVGDLRIQFSFAGHTDSVISVIGKQVGTELQPYVTPAGESILYLHVGERTHLEILQVEHYSNVHSIWMTRGTTWLSTLVGTFLASKTVVFLNRRNQVVRNVMELGPFKLSLILASFLWISACGCVWFTLKPLFGFLLVTFSSAFFLYYLLVPKATPDN